MRNLFKNFGIIIMISLFLSCNKPNGNNNQNDNGLFTKNIVVDGVARRYAIYIPKNIGTSPVPLIFELHGGGVYIEDMTGESGHKTPYKLWMDLAETKKFIIVYPEGRNGTYNKPAWNDCRGDCIVSSNADDVHFIDSLISVISTNHNIDQDRVYASGTSNGGFLALRLASELSNKIAAVASTVAAMPAVSDCNQPSNPISILFMNGTNDNYMPYDGGYLSNPPNPDHGSALSTAASVNYWINFNHTNTIPTTYTYPDLDNSDGGIIEKFIYNDGNQGTEVVFYKINGGGHSAPSIKEKYSALFEQYFNKQNHDIEMTTEVWDFFKNKTLN
ncbi:PHB depolymerase family esterase [Maribacter sp.]|uniref:alpha/beta hydrolase family esterase n=1 Tax=Maribacter sp. TaxID=1897614 RepID=UPI0025C3015B|nr:PHB depolymerase family esterase [Maribacter sp.]